MARSQRGADCIFTATAVVAQPVTGSLLVLHAGYSFWEGWIVVDGAVSLVSPNLLAVVCLRHSSVHGGGRYPLADDS
ncbi:DUF2269 family protein [Bradyrhizobium sp. USDA 4520]